MVGAILIVVAVVIVLPVSFMMLGGGLAAALGFFTQDANNADHEGSELIELNQ